ncbi:SDR family oxidoreductase [Bordetella genomosp. 11]|uniref:Oxidoreductase n=1 Tax=Bordetella genomosp. 11 TaxID=1416808 RepID=A0A261UG89_9BORD|nr:SDR family oxidoreductase [Bordetella genomosp. 11]OZI60605.1 oxidoreductase [Bordetella genomosp. 11]
MQTTGNTILITGGGTGIGQGLARALHQAGNRVIIAGRRQGPLDEVAAANPGIATATVDVADAGDIARFAADIVKQHPALNVVINNAGIMKPENWTANDIDLSVAEATIQTNLLAPLRLTAALLPTLKKQPQATVITVSSGLAFLPLAATPTYSATKAAIHSFSESLRYQLRDTSVRVMELAPPYVQTTLLGDHQATDPNAMPLRDFIDEVMQIIATQPDAEEILVKRVYPLRFAVEQGQEKYREVFAAVNAQAASHVGE